MIVHGGWNRVEMLFEPLIFKNNHERARVFKLHFGTVTSCVVICLPVNLSVITIQFITSYTWFL